MSDPVRDHSEADVVAAGGVVIRTHSGRRQVLMVHRPLGDWSLPKGKLDRGERPEGAALREVHEETGVRCVLGAAAGEVWYLDARQRRKLVLWWAMTPEDDDAELIATDGDEIDGIRWLDLDEAMVLATYETDRRLLAKFA